MSNGELRCSQGEWQDANTFKRAQYDIGWSEMYQAFWVEGVNHFIAWNEEMNCWAWAVFDENSGTLRFEQAKVNECINFALKAKKLRASQC